MCVFVCSGPGFLIVASAMPKKRPAPLQVPIDDDAAGHAGDRRCVAI